ASPAALIGEDCDCSGSGLADVTLDVSPFDVLTDTSTRVRVQALVLPRPDLDPDSVVLLRTDAGDQQLCQLEDNGNLANGDDVAGDSVFSCFVTLFEPEELTLGLRAEAAVDGGSISSAVFAVNVVEPLTFAEAAAILDVQHAALDIWADQLAVLGDTLEAREAAVDEIALLPGVAAAGVGADGLTISIHHETGVIGSLGLNPADTRGGTASENRAAQAAASLAAAAPSVPPTELSPSLAQVVEAAAAEEGPPKVGNKRVLIWDAYDSEFAPDDEGPAIRDLYEDSECPKFDVTYLVNEQCTLDSVKTFANYGTIVMITHGQVGDDSRVSFYTRTPATQGNLVNNGIDIHLGRLEVVTRFQGDVIAVRPGFIDLRVPGKFDNSLIYNGSCSSGANSSLAKSFLDKGVGIYYGYSDTVGSKFAAGAGEQLFEALVEDRKNAGEAYDEVNPKTEPNRNATLFWFGDTDLEYGEGLENGSFELGRLAAWGKSGDGRVVPTLSPVSPTDGQFMGLISTGLGFTTTSGLIEQNFCLPEEATHIRF
ncbi:MAG TPA: hypothetical protein VKU40_10590, partial [Thermoanaerobaculia bacterium]|nr:hypothetical protein [Thermoanaerobaculia bacterium]